MRVFVALDIPEEVRSKLAQLVGGLRPLVRGPRWTRIEGLHVTLKFIGEVAPDTVTHISETLAAVRSTAPVEMHFRNVGFFPSERRPRVFWAGIEGSPNLAELATEIEQRLEPLGIARENRAFHPHLTLARFNSLEGAPELRRALASIASFDFGSMRTTDLHLYRSRLKPGGAEYERLQTFRFAGSTA